MLLKCVKNWNRNFYLIHISQTNESFRPTAVAFDIYASNQAIGMSNNEKSSNGKLNQCLVVPYLIIPIVICILINFVLVVTNVQHRIAIIIQTD